MGDETAVGLHPALSGGIRAHAGEALVPALVGRGPRQRPQGQRIHDDMCTVGVQSAQTGSLHRPGQVSLTLEGHREAR